MDSNTPFFTWDALAGMAGASLATYLFVQLTKDIKARFAPRLPTDLYAATVAFAIVLLSAFQTGRSDPSDWSIYVLSFLNGLLVWATAGKMYDVAIDPPTTGKGGDPNR